MNYFVLWELYHALNSRVKRQYIPTMHIFHPCELYLKTGCILGGVSGNGCFGSNIQDVRNQQFNRGGQYDSSRAAETL